MKFTTHFEGDQFSEWKKKYLRYRALKEHIDELFPAKKHNLSIDTNPQSTSSTNTPTSSLKNSTHSNYGSNGNSTRPIQFDNVASSSFPWNTEVPDRWNSDEDEYLLTKKERADQIITKLLSELQKIDEFYRTVEGELVVGFDLLKAQIATIAIERRKHPIINERRSHPNLHSYHLSSTRTHDMHRSISDPKSNLAAHGENDNSNHNGPAHCSNSLTNHRSLSASSSSPSIDNQHNNRTDTHTSNQHLLPSKHSDLPISMSNSPSFEADAFLNSIQPLKESFTHLLRRMTLLIHFVDLNKYAFERLCLFAEKRSQIPGFQAKFMQLVQSRYFANSRVLEDELIPATYALFAEYFEGGNIEKARVYLLARLTESHINKQDTFLIGLKLGVFLMLAIWTVIYLLHPLPSFSYIYTLNSFAPVYRSMGFLLLLLWFYTLQIYLYDKYRISYIFVFQLNPRMRLTPVHLLNEALNLSIVYFLNVLLLIWHFEIDLERTFRASIYPFSLFAFFCLKLFVPSNWVAQWHTRRTLLYTIFNVMISPISRVHFRESYVADIFTSLVRVFVDIDSSVAFFIVTLLNAIQPDTNHSAVLYYAGRLVPWICCAPLWFRFQQCLRKYVESGDRFPHVFNAIKYALVFSMVIITSFHPHLTDREEDDWQTYRIVWLVCYVASSLYAFVWDIWQDWGLCNLEPNLFLRPTLLYENKHFYYWAIVSNFFLRFVWVLTIVPFSFEDSDDDLDITYFSHFFGWKQITLPMLTLLEMFRRFQWSLLRVEWEQINHGSGFRMSYYVPMFTKQSITSPQNVADGSADKQAGAKNLSGGIFAEVFSMISIVIVIAFLASSM